MNIGSIPIYSSMYRKDNIMRAMLIRRMRQLLDSAPDIANKQFGDSGKTYMQIVNDINSIKDDENILYLFERIVRAYYTQR